jgi:hypothetical protein
LLPSSCLLKLRAKEYSPVAFDSCLCRLYSLNRQFVWLADNHPSSKQCVHWLMWSLCIKHLWATQPSGDACSAVGEWRCFLCLCFRVQLIMQDISAQLQTTEGPYCTFLHVVQTGSGAHPASYIMGTGGSFPRGKVAGREADHSPPTSAEVNKTWIYTSTPPYALMA